MKFINLEKSSFTVKYKFLRPMTHILWPIDPAMNIHKSTYLAQPPVKEFTFNQLAPLLPYAVLYSHWNYLQAIQC